MELGQANCRFSAAEFAIVNTEGANLPPIFGDRGSLTHSTAVAPHRIRDNRDRAVKSQRRIG